MNTKQFEQFKDIPQSKFEISTSNGRLHDVKLDTKPVSYFKDAFRRFCKNKSSVVAAIIIIIQLLFAIFVPIFSRYGVRDYDNYYTKILPSLSICREYHNGFWDGSSQLLGNQAKFDSLDAIGYEWQFTNKTVSNRNAIVTCEKSVDAEGVESYNMYVDSYYAVGFVYKDLSKEQYEALKDYQEETQIQVIYPMQNNFTAVGANYWFTLAGDAQAKASAAQETKDRYPEVSKATAARDEDGNYIPDYKMVPTADYAGYDSLRLDFSGTKYEEGTEPVCSAPIKKKFSSLESYPVLYSSTGTRYVWYSDTLGYVNEATQVSAYCVGGVVSTDAEWKTAEDGEVLSVRYNYYAYAIPNQTGVRVRVLYYEYYNYEHGYYPNFVFGTNGTGQDILSCLAVGARVSFLLSICVCAINFFIGAIYGAIEGYYGGAADIIMERISDILASVPFMVVATLFQLHLAKDAGPILSLIFAFVLTGWIGMASRVRMQFYRFKNQEYVLAARTLGANDGRIIWKHIFPNTLGTIITGSVLAIPGVIFSESMLSYLNIVDLSGSDVTSIGTMLSQGKSFLRDYPHIIFFPALFIALLEISFNLFGNGLRDAFNPSLRGAED